MIYPHTLETTTYHDVKDLQYEVAVLPIGATEPHGMHLPYGEDFLCAGTIADKACGAANAAGAKTIRLPALPYGVDSNQMGFPFAMHVRQQTLNALVRDLLDTLLHYGIHKVVIVNGHGGNEFKSLLRDEYGRREQFLCAVNWWQMGSDQFADVFEIPDDHAGEMETSISLHLFPELVHLDRAGDGAARETDFEAINEGWVQITRPWHLLTVDSSSADPRRATAEKGKRYLDIVVDRLAGFLTQLSAAPYSENLPYDGQL